MCNNKNMYHKKVSQYTIAQSIEIVKLFVIIR